MADKENVTNNAEKNKTTKLEKHKSRKAKTLKPQIRRDHPSWEAESVLLPLITHNKLAYFNRQWMAI